MLQVQMEVRAYKRGETKTAPLPSTSAPWILR